MWTAENPNATIVGVIAAGTIVYLWDRSRRMRRRLHRELWMQVMKRKDRDTYHRMRLEDGFGDAMLDMLANGEITEKRARELYAEMATVGYTGLLPKRPNQFKVKKAIKERLWRLYSRFNPKVVDPKIPGPKPGVEAVDASYDPSKPLEGLSKSKYLNNSTNQAA